MKILLFGGFLGSGKTTIIRAFIDGILRAELGTIAIIENEIGEVGVDDVLLREGSVKMTPLFGGCVCCEITGSLIGAVDEIYKQISPDWLIIELTGVAELFNVKELLDTYSSIGLEIAAIAVVDGSRWTRLQIIGDFIRDQIMGSDLIILNKTDLFREPDPIVDNLKDLTGVNEVMLMAADKDRVADSIRILNTLFRPEDAEDGQAGREEQGHDQEHDHEHDQEHDDHEHDHEHDERIVGAVGLHYSIHPQAAAERTELVRKLGELFTEIGVLLSSDEIIYGHVKGVLQESESSFVRYSLTRLGQPEILTSGAWITAGDGSGEPLSLTLNLNSMIHSEEEIAALLAPCLKRYSSLFTEV
ncbi:MAG: hypothetical protein FWH28_04195 [Clostridiales bacterium]|nr:hypothetical protein [Clostridiales bacterium]